MLVRQKAVVTLGGRLVGIRLAMLVRQSGIVVSSGRLLVRQADNVSQAQIHTERPNDCLANQGSFSRYTIKPWIIEV